MKVAILVLSDIHFTNAADSILGKAKDIARAVYAELPRVDAILMRSQATWPSAVSKPSMR